MVESTPPIAQAGEYYSIARGDCSYNLEVVICVIPRDPNDSFRDETRIPEFNVNHHPPFLRIVHVMESNDRMRWVPLSSVMDCISFHPSTNINGSCVDNYTQLQVASYHRSITFSAHVAL